MEGARMSHYTRVATQIVDEEALVAALADLGFAGDQVERHATAQPLYGYQGDQRPEHAHVIIRRRWIGRASNDLGFVRDSNGVFTAIISEYDRRRFDDAWLMRLRQRYAYHATIQALAQQGFAIAEEHEADGHIRLVLRRSA